MKSLYKSFRLSNSQSLLFQDALKEAGPPPLGNKEKFLKWGIVVRRRMHAWLNALYAVCAGWKKLKLSNPLVDELMIEERVEKLAPFRLSLLFPRTRKSEKFFLAFLEDKGMMMWAMDLQDAFCDYFIAWNEEYATRLFLR